MKKHMLDLYAGLGGMSEAFIQDSSWSVLRIDNNPMLSGVDNMVIMDVKHIDPHPSWTGERIEYIHASPPCDEFSNAYSSPRAIWMRENPGKEYLPNMEWLIEAIRIIELCKPRFWSIENVKGASKYFTPLLGKPKCVIGKFMFWGEFPLFECDANKVKTKAQKDRRHHPFRKNLNGKIDFEISKQMKNAIESQTSIFNF